MVDGCLTGGSLHCQALRPVVDITHGLGVSIDFRLKKTHNAPVDQGRIIAWKERNGLGLPC